MNAPHPPIGPDDGVAAIPHPENARNGPSTAPQQANEAPLAPITLLRANDPEKYRKGYSLDKNGALVKRPAKPYFSGQAERHNYTLPRLARMLRGEPPSKVAALMIGVSEQSKLKMGEWEEGTQHRRTAEEFPFPDGPGLLCIDSDELDEWPDLKTPKDVVLVLEELGLKADCVTSSSASSYLRWPGGSTGLKGLHTFVIVDHGTEIRRVLEILHMRACLVGYGRILVTSNGVMLVRSIVDLALDRSNQPIFEWGAVCGEGVTQDRQVEFHGPESGSDYRMLKADSIAPLSEDKLVRFAEWEREEKAKFQEDADRRRERWLDGRVAHLPSGERATAREALKANLEKTHRNLPPWFELTLDDGSTRTVEALLAAIRENPDKWHRKTIPDPYEPDYRGGCGCATIFCKEQKDGKVKILSMAHGVQATYHLEPRAIVAAADPREFEVLDDDVAEPVIPPDVEVDGGSAVQGARVSASTPIVPTSSFQTHPTNGGRAPVPQPSEMLKDPALAPLGRELIRQQQRIISVLGEVPGAIDVGIAYRFWTRTINIAQNDGSKYLLLTNDGGKKEFTKNELLKDRQLAYTFGSILTPAFHDALRACARARSVEKDTLRGEMGALEYEPLLTLLRHHRQIRHLTYMVSMFEPGGRIDVVEDAATVVLRHRPFVPPPVAEGVAARVGADFGQHFPEFEGLLDAMVWARFAADRRKAFVWLQAESNFGKGLLLAALEELGLTTELTIPQINKAVNGETVPVVPETMLSAWVVSVDEWKGASRELKCMNNSIQVAAKYANRVMVHLYLKLFTSREEVSSLVDGGIEDQFNNRFSYITAPRNDVDERPLMKEIGNGCYKRGLAAYIAVRLNDAVAFFQAMPPEEAEREAGRRLAEYQARHRAAETFGLLEDEVREVAKELHAIVLQFATTLDGVDARYFADRNGVSVPFANALIRNVEPQWFRTRDGVAIKGFLLKKAKYVVSLYLKERTQGSEAAKMGYRTGQIVEELVALTSVVPMDGDGRLRCYGGGDHPIECEGERCRGVALIPR